MAQSIENAKEKDLSQVDLILLDIGLPDGSGLELYKYIKLIKDIPVIFLTANDEEETIVRAFDMGADDYLTKPFKTGELMARIRKILPDMVVFNDIEIDTEKRQVYKDKKLLKYLIRNTNFYFT